MAKTETTKLKRLSYLLDALTDAREDMTDAEDLRKLDEIIAAVTDMYIAARYERGEVLSVYPIVHGCSTECAFIGTMAQCRAYVHRCKEADPKFECIII